MYIAKAELCLLEREPTDTDYIFWPLTWPFILKNSYQLPCNLKISIYFQYGEGKPYAAYPYGLLSYTDTERENVGKRLPAPKL